MADPCGSIQARLKNHQQDMTEIFAQPVEIESPSDDKAALDRLGDLLCGEL